MEENKTTYIGGNSADINPQRKASLESVPLNTGAETTYDAEYISYGRGDKIELPTDEGAIGVEIMEIISAAGTSGEAGVYKVQDSGGRNLALKVYRQLPHEYEPNPEALKRIQKISDEDILPLMKYGLGKHKLLGKYCWELQAYAEGGNLLSVADIKGKYSADFIEHEIVPQLMKGLRKLHDNQIYHCDLKPQNIYYVDSAQTDIVIGDYGSAKTKELNNTDSFTFSKHIVRTRFYTPPEFYEGIIKDNSDYFSMGMVILELLYNEVFAKDAPQVREEITLKRNLHEPMFNYDKRYERLNKLIEGCTLASWDRRWNKGDIESWQKGKIAPIIYRDSKRVQELKLTRQVGVKSVDELVEYGWGLSPDEFHSVLIQDDGVFAHIQGWIFDMLSAEDAKKIAQIRNVYGLKGKFQLKEAMLRYLEPTLPLVLEGQIFAWKEGEVIQNVQRYLAELLSAGVPANPRILDEAIFSLEYALLSLKNSEMEAYRKDAAYLLELMRLILADEKRTDAILGSLVSCDEQNNQSFGAKRLKLLSACLKELCTRHVARDLEASVSLINMMIRQGGMQQALFKEGWQKKFESLELMWWKRFIKDEMVAILNLYAKNAKNGTAVAAEITESLYDLGRMEDGDGYLAKEIKALDEGYHAMTHPVLLGKMDRIATLIKVLHATGATKDKQWQGKLMACLPAEYQDEKAFPAWEGKMPFPKKTLVKLAWICDPQRGLRSSKSVLHEGFTEFLLNHLRSNGNVEADLLEANVFCSLKRGSDHDYATFYNLLKKEQKWIDQKVIKVESGKDVALTGMELDWRNWSVKCKAQIFSSLVLRYSDEGRQEKRQYLSVTEDTTRDIRLENAFSLGKKNLASRVNLSNEDGPRKLEALIAKEAVGSTVPGLEESTYHESRLKEINKYIPGVEKSYQKHLATQSALSREKLHAWLRESFRWLSLGIIVPLTWIAQGLWSEINPSLIPLFLYGIPLVVLIGALPFFHKNQAKWWILGQMLVILGIAFIQGGSSFDRMQILLSWQKYVIIGIAITHLISFLHDNSELSKRVAIVGNILFWLLGVGVLATMVVNAPDIKPIISVKHDRSEGAISCIRIPGGEAVFQGHSLKLDSYYIAEREVTVGDFREFTAQSNYVTEAEQGEGSFAFPKRGAWAEFWSGRDGSHQSSASWRNPYMKQNDNHPVVCVSFEDAAHYCNWLSAKEGFQRCYSFKKNKISCDWKANGYRLPTEAEWEWAASGASAGGYYPGKASGYKKVAWYSGNTKYTTKPVMKKRPNPLGLYDMIGNVYEWCWDRFAQELPTTISDNYRGPASGKYRSIRGGSWFSNLNRLDYKVRTRNGWDNGDLVLNSGSFIGFRVVRSDSTD